jgi:hypothetical protein
MSDFQYRHFIYLDSEEILSVAPIIDGGEISDDIHTLTRQLGGRLGADFGIKTLGARISLGGDGSKSYKREFKLRQTAYVAANKVLNALKPDDIDLKKITSTVEKTIVKCDVNLHMLKADGKPRKKWRDKFWRTNDPRKTYNDKYGERQDMCVELLNSRSNDFTGTVLLLALEPQWLLKPYEFDRRATVIGQVVAVRREQEKTVENSDGTFKFALQTEPAAIPQQASRQSLPVALPGKIERDPRESVIRLRPIAIFK